MTMPKMKIKTGDTVIVRVGRDRGKIGVVEKAFPKDSKVLVSGVNLYKKHQKPTQQDAGGYIDKNLPIHVSNVAILDPETNRPTRIGYSVGEDGKKKRIAKKSGKEI